MPWSHRTAASHNDRLKDTLRHRALHHALSFHIDMSMADVVARTLHSRILRQHF
jgi:hypothetical protein